MSWPTPRAGLVIRYSYLWQGEAAAGREEGVKDRPCAVVLALQAEDGDTMVYVLPITHTAPLEPDDAVEIPQATKRRLALDSERSWIVVSEGNNFVWPGPDLRPLPGKGPESAAYGLLPGVILDAVRTRFLTRIRDRRAGVVKRTE
jgi:hypothetical protein